MVCSNCGKESSLNQKFCRSCGNKLLSVSSDDSLSSNPANERKQPIIEWANKIGIIGAILLAALIAVLFIFGLISNLIGIYGYDVRLKSLGFLLGLLFHIGLSIALISIIVGIFLKIVGWLIGPKLSIRKKDPKIISPARMTNRLESEQSITEHTTELLNERVIEAENVDSKTRGR